MRLASQLRLAIAAAAAAGALAGCAGVAVPELTATAPNSSAPSASSATRVPSSTGASAPTTASGAASTAASSRNTAVPTKATQQEEAAWQQILVTYYAAYNKAVATRDTTEYRSSFSWGSYTGETVADLLDRYAAVGTAFTGAVCTVRSLTATYRFGDRDLILDGTVETTEGAVLDNRGKVLEPIPARVIPVNVGMKRKGMDSPWLVVSIFEVVPRSARPTISSLPMTRCGAMI